MNSETLGFASCLAMPVIRKKMVNNEFSYSRKEMKRVRVFPKQTEKPKKGEKMQPLMKYLGAW